MLDPTAPTKSINKMQRYRDKFGADRAEQIVEHMKETGKQLGINFSYGGNTGSTLQSHRLIEYAAKHGKQDALVNQLFKAYFEDEKDITLTDVLTEAAVAAGLEQEPVKNFLDNSDLYTEDVKQKMQQNAEMGITGVPFFIVGNKYAVSGAQTEDVFLDIFKRLGVDVNKKVKIEGNANAGEACARDGKGAQC